MSLANLVLKHRRRRAVAVIEITTGRLEDGVVIPNKYTIKNWISILIHREEQCGRIIIKIGTKNAEQNLNCLVTSYRPRKGTVIQSPALNHLTPKAIVRNIPVLHSFKFKLIRIFNKILIHHYGGGSVKLRVVCGELDLSMMWLHDKGTNN